MSVGTPEIDQVYLNTENEAAKNPQRISKSTKYKNGGEITTKDSFKYKDDTKSSYSAQLFHDLLITVGS